jgi:hypothetical protein
MPEGRADPAACARLRNAVEQYGLWSKQPDSPASIAQRAKYRKEWDDLKAARACRPAPAPAPAPPAPPPLWPGPGGLAPQPPMVIERVPVWVWVAGGALLLLFVGGGAAKAYKRGRKLV